MPGTDTPPHDRITVSQEVSHALHTTVGTFQGFIATTLCLPTGILTAAFLSRNLGPENYGIFTVASTIIIYIEATITMGFRRTAEKFVAQEADWQGVASRLLQVQLMCGLGAFLALMAFAPFIASWLATDELTTHLRLFSLKIPMFAVANINLSILIGLGFFNRRAILLAFYWLSRLFFVFLFVGLYPSVSGAIWAIIVSTVVLFIGTRAYVKPSLFVRSSFPLRNVWSYTWPLFFFTMTRDLFNILDLLYVKMLSVLPASAGYYSAAKNLTIVPGLLGISFSPILLAKLSGLLAQGQRDFARRMVGHSIRFILCLLPFAAMSAGAADEIVTAIFGVPFLPGGNLLALLIFSALGSTMISVTTSMLIAAGHPRLPFILMFPLVVAAFGALPLAIPRFGPIGAAAVTTTLALLGATGMITAVNRVWHIHLPFSSLARSILVCGFAYGVAIQWPAPGFLLLLKIPAISIVIVLAFLLLGEFRAGDINFMRSMIRSGKAS
ncbi:lipopolysaccharide biosynthesis protein [Candidatus Latescibacterota bacterium]